MLKNFKTLFIREDEEQQKPESVKEEGFSFPVNTSDRPSTPSEPSTISDPIIKEIIGVYESGLDSINMPGYDFYEFYQTVSVAGGSEQAYTMGFQMGKTLDKTLTPQKLLHDAEFYISKINEVYSQYVNQGQSKLSGFENQKNNEKKNLNAEIDQASSRIQQLKSELQQLENDIKNKKDTLSKIDSKFYPQEKSVQEILNANNFAYKTSISKLNTVKEGIVKYIKF